jgi:hypothetical protein
MFPFMIGLRAAASADARSGREPKHPNNSEYMTAYAEAQVQSNRCRVAVGQYKLQLLPPQAIYGGDET